MPKRPHTNRVESNCVEPCSVKSAVRWHWVVLQPLKLQGYLLSHLKSSMILNGWVSIQERNNTFKIWNLDSKYPCLHCAYVFGDHAVFSYCICTSSGLYWCIFIFLFWRTKFLVVKSSFYFSNSVSYWHYATEERENEKCWFSRRKKRENGKNTYAIAI